MSVGGRELVDGKGASRVCAAMMEDAKVESVVRVRRATESDCRLLWEWANEPGVRASSFSQRPIGWEEHSHWFQGRLADEKCTMLIGEDARGRAIGQVRFDQQPGGEAEIDVSVAPDLRGSGYGSLLIDTALREVFASISITKVNAFIRPENLSSVRAFEKAGFQRIGEKLARENSALHYCRRREPQS
jgi:UDP-2,4-diacetamido-2,4,6-trideoxy-beta-L-altropyranose hydrolase